MHLILKIPKNTVYLKYQCSFIQLLFIINYYKMENGNRTFLVLEQTVYFIVYTDMA